MSAVTGWDFTADELIITGKRIANMRNAFNIREGLNQREFELPAKILGILLYNEVPLAGKTLDIDTLVNYYHTAMEWDTKTAKPNKKARRAQVG
jgi:aldehyde:ferredoxin oxidoreductase